MKLFINYRRLDTNPESHCISDRLGEIFGSDQVFIDDGSIRSGDDWPSTIESALEEAGVMLVVIGPKWLFVQNQHGVRRLDCPGDWVRREIENGLAQSKTIIPVLLGGVGMPSLDALPESIKLLSRAQAHSLRQDHWNNGFTALADRLAGLGMEKISEVSSSPDLMSYPGCQGQHIVTSDDDINRLLSERPGWAHLKRDGKQSLQRNFRFKSFDDAVHFMGAASRPISKYDHHPEWRNVDKIVEVKLSTFDAGFRVTSADFDLADLLTEVYTSYRS